MNNDKSQNQALSGATREEKKVTGVNGSEHKEAPYTWEITRIRKKQIALSKYRFLLLTVNIPVKHESGQKIRSFQSYKLLPIEKLQDQEYFESVCAIGFTQIKKQLKEKGLEIPD